MRGTRPRMGDPSTTIRDVRLPDGPAVQRLLAGAVSLSEAVGRLPLARTAG